MYLKCEKYKNSMTKKLIFGQNVILAKFEFIFGDEFNKLLSTEVAQARSRKNKLLKKSRSRT